ncbi:hypothetical protein, partial [Microvirga sp. GCM10011540]|uniref:hypothetical protein n=1 Tax=Microvirga sp. GCM10011540 TaxID=3317338 RepID=UPI00366FBBB4
SRSGGATWNPPGLNPSPYSLNADPASIAPTIRQQYQGGGEQVGAICMSFEPAEACGGGEQRGATRVMAGPVPAIRAFKPRWGLHAVIPGRLARAEPDPKGRATPETHSR